jgi:hypothetical protein
MLTTAAPEALAHDLRRGQAQHDRGADEAVEDCLREHNVHHELPERRRKAEDLQEREPRESFQDRQHDEPRHLHQGLAHAETLAGDPDPEADDRLRERLDADEAAAGRVLKQPGDEPGEASELRAAAERQQHDHDQRQVGRHAPDAQHGRQRRVRDGAPRDRQHEQSAHQPPASKNAVRSRCVSPVTSSTSSTRA